MKNEDFFLRSKICCRYFIFILIYGLIFTLTYSTPPAVSGTPQSDKTPITAWPILRHGISGDTQTTDVLWPLFHHEKSPTKKSFSIRPLIFSSEKWENKKTTVHFLGPLNMYEKKKNYTWCHSFPFYWYERSPQNQTTILFPFYWDLHSKNSDSKHFWPLYGKSKHHNYTEISTLYPFFRYGWDPVHSETSIDALWPIFHYHKKNKKISHRLLPLYSFTKDPNGSKGFIFPYFWNHHSEEHFQGIFPVWYNKQQKNHEINLVLPFYYYSKKPSSTLKFITPLYTEWESDHRNFRALLPLYFRFQSEDHSLSTFLPIYFGFKTPQKDLRVAFPFYYHFKNTQEDISFTYFFPFYGTYQKQKIKLRRFLLFPVYAQYKDAESGYRSYDFLWPFLHYGGSDKEKTIWALPFFTHIKRPEYRITSAFPLYFSYKSPTTIYHHELPFYIRYSKQGYTKRFFLGPVYINTQNTETNLTAHDFFFPLVHFKSEGDEVQNWIFPFYFNHTQKDHATCALFPFYFSVKHPGTTLKLMPLPPFLSYKSKELSCFHLWPFYGKMTQGSYVEHSVVWPLFRFGQSPDSDRHTLQILNWIHHKDDQKSRTTFFPLWYHSHSPSRTKDISLFLHAYTSNKKLDRTEFSFLWVAPHEFSLFHLQKDPDKIRHSLFPLYRYASNQSDDSRSFDFLWLFFNSEKKGQLVHTVSLLSGLISYERKSASDRDFRFLWRFIRSAKTDTTCTFELNPLYYRHSDSENGSYWAVLGGLIGRTKKSDGTSKMKFLWVF